MSPIQSCDGRWETTKQISAPRSNSARLGISLVAQPNENAHLMLRAIQAIQVNAGATRVLGSPSFIEERSMYRIYCCEEHRTHKYGTDDRPQLVEMLEFHATMSRLRSASSKCCRVCNVPFIAKIINLLILLILLSYGMARRNSICFDFVYIHRWRIF